MHLQHIHRSKVATPVVQRADYNAKIPNRTRERLLKSMAQDHMNEQS